MAYLMTVEDMIADIQQYLDLDPRFFDQEQGVVDFGSEKIGYVRMADEYKLTIQGSNVFVPRI